MKLARDTWLTLQYEAGLLVRNPVNIAISLLQPVTYLLLFTPFLKSVMGVSTYSGAYQIYVPSLLTAMGVFSGMFAGFAMLAAIGQGVIGRFRVTPLSRVGLMLGRQLVFVMLTCFQGVVITVIALLFGLRAPVINVLVALVLLALMVLIGVSISYLLAIFVPTQDCAREPDQRGHRAARAAGRGADPPVGGAAVGTGRRPVEPVRLGGQRHAGRLPGEHRRPGRVGGERHPGRDCPDRRDGVITAVRP